MPDTAFDASLPFILRWEGGFVDHRNDPGGRTNKGVTQRVYNDWRGRQGLPAADVKNITDAEVRSIYETNYWRPPRCDVLQRQLDLVQFDTAVNMGPGRAVRFLQQALGCGVDGAFGQKTEQAAAGCDLASALIDYCNVREQFYRNLVANNSDLNVFLKGWMNRLNALRHEVGLPGFEAAPSLDFGDASYIGRIEDIDGADERR
jgi:lysozyme family protein